ncbi:MAG: hypothetical protein AB7L91_16580 [Dehalococcoidia bacterium]
MTLERRDDELAGAADDVCEACGHAASDHVVQAIEGDGLPEERGYCLECEDWHDFVPLPE